MMIVYQGMLSSEYKCLDKSHQVDVRQGPQSKRKKTSFERIQNPPIWGKMLTALGIPESKLYTVLEPNRKVFSAGTDIRASNPVITIVCRNIDETLI